jgi:hypothetical protein
VLSCRRIGPWPYASLPRVRPSAIWLCNGLTSPHPTPSRRIAPHRLCALLLDAMEMKSCAARRHDTIPDSRNYHGTPIRRLGGRSAGIWPRLTMKRARIPTTANSTKPSRSSTSPSSLATTYLRAFVRQRHTVCPAPSGYTTLASPASWVPTTWTTYAAPRQKQCPCA